MSALPSANLNAAPAPEPEPLGGWAQWIEAKEAAGILGVNRDHFLRRCRDELASIQGAVLRRPPGGGTPRWFVNRLIDPRLQNPDRANQQAMPDLLKLSQHEREEVFAKAACVKAFRDAKMFRPGLLSVWLPLLINELRIAHPKISISKSGLYRWDGLLKTDADLLLLLDKRGGDQKASGEKRAWDFFAHLYLSESNLTVATAWRQTDAWAIQNGAQWCSQRTCERRLDQMIPPQTQLFHRKRAAWRSRCQTYTDQDDERFAAGRCWESDHTQMDLWVRYGELLIRPWLTVFKDWRTRRVVGWCLSASPNSDTILAAFSHAIRDPANMGGPTEVIIDNGKDYDSYFWNGRTKTERHAKKILEKGYVDENWFQGLYGLMNIQVHFSLPYNPNGKSRTERWFGILHDQFDKLFPTYTGNKPENRPEGLADVLQSQRHRIPTFEQIQRQVGEYIQGFNARADHNITDLAENGLKLSPDQAMAQWCSVRLMPKSDKVLDLLLKHWYKPVIVGKNGVTIAPYGVPLTYGKHNTELARFKSVGQRSRGKANPRVLVSFDPQDLREIFVWTTDYRLIDRVRENTLGGLPGPLGRELCATEARAKHHYKRMLRMAKDGYHREYLTASEALRDAALEEYASKRPTETTAAPGSVPGTMKLVQTPIDDAVKDADRINMRQAVGAECEPLPPIRGKREWSDEDAGDDAGGGPLASLADLSRLSRRDDNDDFGDLVLPSSAASADEDDTDVPFQLPPPVDAPEDGHVLDELQ